MSNQPNPISISAGANSLVQNRRDSLIAERDKIQQKINLFTAFGDDTFPVGTVLSMKIANSTITFDTFMLFKVSDGEWISNIFSGKATWELIVEEVVRFFPSNSVLTVTLYPASSATIHGTITNAPTPPRP